MHQQQMAYLAQQQALLVAAIKSGAASQPPTKPLHQNLNPSPNLSASFAPTGTFPAQAMPVLGYQVPVMVAPVLGQNGVNNFGQVNDKIYSLVFLMHAYCSSSFLLFCNKEF